jgi:hypothetical protein
MQSRKLDNSSWPVTVARAPQVRRWGWVLTGASIVVIGAATLIPQAGHSEGSPVCIFCGSLGGVDAVLNVLLFLPLGIGLALTGMRARTALLAVLILSTAIELAQLLVISGRDAALGDVLANVLGGAAGFSICRWNGAWWNPSRRGSAALSVVWMIGWLAIQVVVSYALAPVFPATHYYGQIARVFEHMATFGGRVLSATIDTVQIPDFGFSKTEEFRILLEQGATVRAVVIPAGPTPRVAPIVRLADDRRRQIVLLGQDRADVVFGVHTGATNLRLRPPLFRLGGVFPAEGSVAGLRVSDTLDLRARYRATGVEIRASSSASTRSEHYALTNGLGWILFLPRQWYVQGSPLELVVSWVWFAILLLPLGYWACLAAADLEKPLTQFIPLLAGVAIFLGVGIALVPRSFGMKPGPAAAWFAAAMGIVAGASFARARRVFRPGSNGAQ